MTAPRATPTRSNTGLNYMVVEVSWGSRWIDINDHLNYKISGSSTRDSATRTYRKTTVQSPVLSGSYLVHAVPDMTQETVGVWVYGASQTELNDNFYQLLDLFQQWSFRIRWTFDEYREYWNCSLADVSYSRNQVWTHSLMASVQFTIPVYPEVSREALE